MHPSLPQTSGQLFPFPLKLLPELWHWGVSDSSFNYRAPSKAGTVQGPGQNHSTSGRGEAPSRYWHQHQWSIGQGKAEHCKNHQEDQGAGQGTASPGTHISSLLALIPAVNCRISTHTGERQRSNYQNWAELLLLWWNFLFHSYNWRK